jgi:hypothetical protein
VKEDAVYMGSSRAPPGTSDIKGLGVWGELPRTVWLTYYAVGECGCVQATVVRVWLIWKGGGGFYTPFRPRGDSVAHSSLAFALSFTCRSLPVHFTYGRY